MTNFVKKFVSKSSQAAQIPQFFFDEAQDSKTTKFWSKDDILKEGKKPTQGASHFFYKKSKKKFGELKPVYLSLFKSFLILSQMKEWSTKQYKSLDLSKNIVVLQRINTTSGKYAGGISLTYNQKQTEFYAKTIEDLNSFIYQMKKYIVQVNFEEMYSLDRKLGSGSYADVYRVKDRLTKRDFAAKLFDMSSFRDASRSKIALRNEIVIHRQLEHGNVCKLHEVFETPTHIILVLEYIRGERLIDYVIENSPLTEKESMIILKELLEGLLYLNSLGIIHRDLKLENVMFYKDKKEPERITIKLIDFGLSVSVDNVELFKRSGTPGYVAPEVLLADTYDTKVDVFSAGVILFTMLSGRSPFVGPDRASVLKLNKKCEYTFKPKHWDNKTPAAKDLVQKMMEGNPDKRVDAGGALCHRWFAPIFPDKKTINNNNINNNNTSLAGVQSLNTMSKLPNSGRSMNPGPQDASVPKSTERTMEKSRTTFDNPQNVQNAIQQRTTVKAMTINSNPSNSIQTFESNQQQKQLSMLNTMKSNLLQIPQQYMMLSSLDGTEDEKFEMEGSYDGMMNKASLRSFYKMDSSQNFEGPPSDNFATIEKEAMFDTNPDPQEPAIEGIDVLRKIKSLATLDKSTRSPFRSNSRPPEPNLNVVYTDHNTPRKKISGDFSSETFENSKVLLPSSTMSTFKASMIFVKQASTVCATKSFE